MFITVGILIVVFTICEFIERRITTEEQQKEDYEIYKYMSSRENEYFWKSTRLADSLYIQQRYKQIRKVGTFSKNKKLSFVSCVFEITQLQYLVIFL